MIGKDALETIELFLSLSVDERETTLWRDRDHPDACPHCIAEMEYEIERIGKALDEVRAELAQLG